MGGNMLLDGKQLSSEIKNRLKNEVCELTEKYNIMPKMAIVMAGENEASMIYVRNKVKAAELVGIKAQVIKLDASVTQEQMNETVDELNCDPSVHGIIVQLPLPKHLDEFEIINRIDDQKDIDGFHLLNKGRLFTGKSSFVPATPYGIIELLIRNHVEITGKRAVVVGRSNIVGKPVAMLLLDHDATVTIAHSKTHNLGEVTREADILVVAVGKANLITSDMVKPGAVVVDVGINRDQGKLCGDVDFEKVKDIASYITPVPGGVGPMTIAMLLVNTVEGYKKQVAK
jgi:methylenetetrahydrofolate dehydrogenase (NADP+)/methenyltetrahydrofolate cyclohydrolase